jgi:hypothetical protein
VATLVARNVNEAIVVPVLGSGGVCAWRESGVRRSGLCLCVWQESGFSRLKMCSHLIYFINKFYKCCTFNAICKDNATINCITVQHKEVHFRHL